MVGKFSYSICDGCSISLASKEENNDVFYNNYSWFEFLVWIRCWRTLSWSFFRSVSLIDFRIIFFFSDPKYCHIYHDCGIGRHQVRKCGENLWFSPEKEGCEWPHLANCNVSSITNWSHWVLIGKAGHLYTLSTVATDMIDGDGNRITTPRYGRLTNVYTPIECPPKVQGYFADPYDCSVYHYCNGMFENYLWLFIGSFSRWCRSTCLLWCGTFLG